MKEPVVVSMETIREVLKVVGEYRSDRDGPDMETSRKLDAALKKLDDEAWDAGEWARENASDDREPPAYGDLD